MGRLDPKHSDDHREAVIRNMLERGESAAATVRAAAAGELGLPAFTIGETTCRRLAREARRDGRQDVRDDAGRKSTAEVQAVAEATIARVKALRAPTAKDLSALQQAHRVVQDTERTAAKRAPLRPTRPANGQPSPLMRQLMDKMLEEEQAREEGRPCACEQPVPQSWDHDDDGNPICHGCRLPIKDAEERAAAEQERKEAARREWQGIKAERQGKPEIVNGANDPPSPTTRDTQPPPQERHTPQRTNGRKRRDDYDPRDWSLLT